MRGTKTATAGIRSIACMAAREPPANSIQRAKSAQLRQAAAGLAMLIALLLPTLSRAKEEAKLVQCQTNLRTMYSAAQIHMIDHHGFLPAAGWHFDPPGGIVNPRGLNDERRTRYIYYNDNGIERP